MKKLIMVVLIAAVSVVSIFADTRGSASGTVGDNPEAYTVVTLDLTQDEDGEAYVELWFEGGSTTTENSISSPKKSVKLEFENGSSVASNSANGSNDELFACWRIVSANSFDVELALQDKLSASGVENKIDWNVTWGDSGEIESKSLASAVNHEVSGTLPAGIKNGLETEGRTQLTVSTDSGTDFSQLSAGSYSANLYLRCKTN